MRAEQNSLNERLNEMKIAGTETKEMLKCEQTKSSGLLKQLKYYESQQKSLQLEREECRRIKKKLVDLQSIETLYNGKNRGEFNNARAHGCLLFWYLSSFVMCKACHQYNERLKALALLNSPQLKVYNPEECIS